MIDQPPTMLSDRDLDELRLENRIRHLEEREQFLETQVRELEGDRAWMLSALQDAFGAVARADQTFLQRMKAVDALLSDALYRAAWPKQWALKRKEVRP